MEGGWIKTAQPSTGEPGQNTDSSKTAGEEENEKVNHFALPKTIGEYPMWLLSLPWYVLFILTVPDCSKVRPSADIVRLHAYISSETLLFPS